LATVKLSEGTVLDSATVLLAYRNNASHRHGRAVVAEVASDGSVAFEENDSRRGVRDFLGHRVEEVAAVALPGQERGLMLYRKDTDMLAKVFWIEAL